MSSSGLVGPRIAACSHASSACLRGKSFGWPRYQRADPLQECVIRATASVYERLGEEQATVLASGAIVSEAYLARRMAS